MDCSKSQTETDYINTFTDAHSHDGKHIVVPPFSYKTGICDLSNLEGYNCLSDQQKLFLYVAVYGRLNIFLTGSAGSGKSFALTLLEKAFIQLGLKLQFTSTTGVSAIQLPNGITLHSWLGLGLAEGSPKKLALKASKDEEIKSRWLEVDCLVVDEISMMKPQFLDTLNLCGQQICGNDRPFGGKQIIFVGDMAQLPPVYKSDLQSSQQQQHPKSSANNKYSKWEKHRLMQLSEEDLIYLSKFDNKKFCFQHPQWDDYFDCVISLEKVFRQSNDPDFAEMLGRIRFGKQTPQDIALLRSKCNNSTTKDVALYEDCVYMYAINRKVDELNENEINKIKVEPIKNDYGKIIKQGNYKKFTCKSRMHKADDSNRDVFQSWLQEQKQGLVKPEIEVVVGSKVMLLVNKSVEDGLCNGIVGIVKEFNPVTGYPIVRFPIPSSLIIQKKQNSSSSTTTSENKDDHDHSNNKKMKLNDGAEHNVSIAVSSVRKLLDDGCKYQDVEVTPHVFEYKDESAVHPAKKYGKDSHKWSHSVPRVEYEQIPLRVAYAMSMHKSQGKTLQHVVIDAKNIFDEGQFYVALSRCETLDGVKLINFDPGCIRTNKLVVAFYDKLRQDNENWINRLNELKSNASEAEVLTQLVREFHQRRQYRVSTNGQQTLFTAFSKCITNI